MTTRNRAPTQQHFHDTQRTNERMNKRQQSSPQCLFLKCNPRLLKTVDTKRATRRLRRRHFY